MVGLTRGKSRFPTVRKGTIRWSRARRELVCGAIIHAMGERIILGHVGTVTAHQLFKRSHLLLGVTLSVHCLIKPDGTIVRCMGDDREAYHAGHSKFGELENLNRTFLGAEFLVAGEWDYAAFRQEMLTGKVGYTAEQYDAGGWLYATWMKAHGFGLNQILGHFQVSGDHVRGKGNGKLDPGHFNRGRFNLSLHRWMGELG